MSVSNEGARQEWRGWSLWSTLAGTVYLLVTGLVILLAPFGLGAQLSVIAHTVGGLFFLLPLFWYLGPHFWRRVGDKFSHLLLLGWMAGLLMMTCVVSGLVVTYQAAFTRRMSYTWDLVHTVSGCAVAVILVIHCLTAVRKNQFGERAAVHRLLVRTTAVGIVLGAVTFFSAGLVSTPATRQPLPENYGFRYGPNPFSPSLATTDWLWRVEKDRRWLTFLDELTENPGRGTPEGVADFLAGAQRQHRADAVGRRRGETHVDDLGRFEIDGERIAALRALARPGGADTAALAKLRAQVASDLDDAKGEFEAHGGIKPSALAGSRSCGTQGCHEEILAEWEPSAHRYASRSAFFQLIQGAMAESNGAESTRYCAGCHDPISLFSGGKNIFQDDLSSEGADEGISCIACHRIIQTDVQGNANYVLSPPDRYLAEDSFLGRFLIRAYPRHHKATYSRPLLQTPEFCGACHKQFIDKEVNRATRVQLQNQYDGWKGSHWFVPDEKNPGRADPDKSLSCRDCHMRLEASGDPGAKEPGKHRHHGYIAANQWLPLFHKLPHAEKHVRLTEEWLKGETVIPEIADRWPGGPPVPLRIEAPKSVKIGETVKIRVIADNRKVGHTFPTGPLDVIQAWIEVRVTQDGREIFRSGALDKDGFIQTGAWMLKAEGVDRAGNLIDRHNLWDMVGARFRRVLFPGTTDQEEYTFECACGDTRGIEDGKAELVAADGGPLEVTAVLHYRKVDQTLLNVLQPDGKARSPVTDMSHASARIEIVKP